MAPLDAESGCTGPLSVRRRVRATARDGDRRMRLDRSVPGAPIASNVKANVGLLHWLVSQGGPATIVGLILIAVALSAAGFFLAGLVWRVRIGRKWRRRAAQKGPKQAI